MQFAEWRARSIIRLMNTNMSKRPTRASEFLRDLPSWAPTLEQAMRLHQANYTVHDHTGTHHAPADGGSPITYALYRDGSCLCLRDGQLYECVGSPT